MAKISLKAKKRKLKGKKAKQLRDNDLIPLVVYGHGFKPKNIEAPQNVFASVYHKAGSSNLVDLEIEGTKPIKVLIQDVQTNPVSDEFVHADLYRIRKDRKLRTQIPLHFFGKSKAVENKEGNLITHKDSVEVEVLPDDLIDEIKVDISPLKTFEDVIKVSDLDVPDIIEIIDEKDEIIANVTPPRSEEELETLDEEVEESVEAVEVMAEKKEEGEEAVEGAETAEAAPDIEGVAPSEREAAVTQKKPTEQTQQPENK